MTREQELYNALRRLVDRIDFNGGLGEYKGGPAFVMRDARNLILNNKDLYIPMTEGELRRSNQ